VETNAEGCAGDTLIFPTVIKTIFTPPAPSGNTILCSKDSPAQTYSTPFNTPGSVYTWHVSGGSILSGNGTSQAIVSWNQPSGGRIWYEENSTTATANCYGSSDTLYITIKPSPDPGPIKGNTALCAGTGTYYVNAHTGALYQWSLTNGSILSGSGTSVITAGWTGPGADTLVLVETASNGCATDPIKLPVTVYSVPVISELTGNTELCELSGPQQYIALSPTSATSRFLWSARNGTVTGRPDDDTVTVKWKTDQSLSYSLSVIEISKDSCPGQPFGKTLRLSGSSPSITSVSCVRELKAIEIAWAPGTAFQPYDLYRRALSGADTSWKVLKKKLYTPHYTDTLVNYGLHPYQYSYSTFACNDTVFSMPHNSIQLNALAGHNSVRLSWNRYNNWKENVARYEVWKKTDQETDYSFLLSAGHDTSAEVSTIHGFSHCFAVKAIENSTSNAAWSSHLCLETPHPVSVPSAFSPNGDGVNDIWVINGILSYPGSILEIFNRWGEKVFEAAGYQNNWNGTFNGKRLPDGTYFYILDLRSPAEGTKTRYNGNVTIAR
jgi:gliding motility-associated-like protein